METDPKKVEELKKLSEAVGKELGGLAEKPKPESPSFVEHVAKMRKQFAGQLQQTMNSLQACEKQAELFKQQIEQIKGAIFALDQLATATKGGPYGREERATEEVSER